MTNRQNHLMSLVSRRVRRSKLINARTTHLESQDGLPKSPAHAIGKAARERIGGKLVSCGFLDNLDLKARDVIVGRENLLLT